MSKYRIEVLVVVELHGRCGQKQTQKEQRSTSRRANYSARENLRACSHSPTNQRRTFVNRRLKSLVIVGQRWQLEWAAGRVCCVGIAEWKEESGERRSSGPENLSARGGPHRIRRHLHVCHTTGHGCRRHEGRCDRGIGSKHYERLTHCRLW